MEASLVAQLCASVDLPPDALDLFETFQIAAVEIKSAGEVAYGLHSIKHPVSRGTLASAKAAALRVLNQVEDYERRVLLGRTE